MPGGNGQWQFWIDRGGTFTDIVALDPARRIHTLKLLSVNPGAYDDAAFEGMRRLLGITKDAPFPTSLVTSVRMGTTVATNALLERKGEPLVLVITRGVGDILEIGTQARPDIFARRIVKPELLYRRVIEAGERVHADGMVERPLDREALTRDLEEARAEGFTAVAIVFMHAYAYPQHERQAATIARDLGFTQVSVSHEVSPLIRIVGRGDTTVADAYLSPVLSAYVDRVARALRAAPADAGAAGSTPRLHFMTSAGGLKSAEHFHGRDGVLSGPAGGVIAMAETARRAGFDRAIGFDMGGTSTDVAHFAGAYERTFETVVAGVRLRVPMLNVHTVAAGGGSILAFDGTRLRVGPESAGSNPGPMCYRRGGPLTVTDANVVAGKLIPEHFPSVFGPNANEPIDVAGARAAFEDLARSIGSGKSAEETADDFLAIAVEAMAGAIKRISVARGHDVSRYVLNCFGSAGGQHACLIAETLGMKLVLIHPLSGLLSAYGMGIARLRASREQSIETVLDDGTMASIERQARRLGDDVTAELVSEGVALSDIAIVRRVHLAYEGSEAALPVEFSEAGTMRRAFEALHRIRFGFVSPEKRVVVVLIEVEGEDRHEIGVQPVVDTLETRATQEPVPAARFYSRGHWNEAPIRRRASLAPGDRLDGPALVIEPHQTVVVEQGWSLAVTEHNDLLVTHSAPRRRPAIATEADPALVEVFANRFMGIAEEMGEALRASAQSVNIRERLDFSCAVFDADGALVSNAPHVPVHLGSMDRSVATVIRETHGTMRPGDAYMLNAPYNGGTHLPDITVVTPVFVAEDRPLFFVASRGHHADIGGITPGSMSPSAISIEEEGVYIETFKLIDAGRFREAETLALLTGARHPARNPRQNIADLKAQVAANARGATELERLVNEMGREAVIAYMGHVQDAAEEAVRRVISQLSDGHARIETDQGSVVAVTVKVDRGRRCATIDFTGTSPEQASNFNAPEPVTRAAVLYCLRVMFDKSLPLNAGCLRPVEIVIPPGSMLSPRYPAAVVAGNTETSQIVTNAILAALGAMAPAQGTMNNLTFGDDSVQYYETICSGAPAGPGFDGAAAVHVHMTNTRLTDPEVLELRYPVLLEEFSIRRGSGGKGRWKSGDGTRRTLRFLRPMRLAILSGYRRLRPPGLAGGMPGAAGRNAVRRNDGRMDTLAGCDETMLAAGEAIVIETPTGGGYGPPK